VIAFNIFVLSQIRLGRPSAQYPGDDFRINELFVTGEEEEVLVRHANCLSVCNARELFSKLARPLTASVLVERDWLLLSEIFGEPRHAPPTVDWLRALVSEDGMVNSFERARPRARGRYTCWNQQENKRYSNEGTRIDHILVDGPMWEAAGRVGSVLSGYVPGYTPDKEDADLNFRYGGIPVDDETELQASLSACTAMGLFHMAPYDKSGIPDAPAEAYQFQFAGRSTGILYTPPEFSDHVAISLLLFRGEACGGATYPLLLGKDAATKRTQPHSSQSSITSFFSAKTVSSVVESSSQSGGMTQHFSSSSTASSSSTESGNSVKRKLGMFNYFAAVSSEDHKDRKIS